MDLQGAIASTRADFDGFNSPAHPKVLAELHRLFGPLPEEVPLLYQDHDGSNHLPHAGSNLLAARLMPISEVIKTRDLMLAQAKALPKVGEIAWLWTDDNSNYCGIYTEGLLRGWVCILEHEEPMLAPAFRSITSFMSRLLADALHRNGREGACTIPWLAREIPETAPDSSNHQKDRELASLFRKRYDDEANEDLRRLFAFCSICLTPFEDSERLTAFLLDVDIWTPEAAVRLLEVRRWREGVEQLERLAREGKPNGDAAAMRLLVRMNTDQSRQAVARLKQTLHGQKLRSLEMWADQRSPLQPPRW